MSYILGSVIAIALAVFIYLAIRRHRNLCMVHVTMTFTPHWDMSTFGFKFARTRSGYVEAFEAACGATDIFVSSMKAQCRATIVKHVPNETFTIEVRHLDETVASVIVIRGSRATINQVRTHLIRNIPRLSAELRNAA